MLGRPRIAGSCSFENPISAGPGSGWIDENYDRSFHDPDLVEDPTILDQVASVVAGHGPLDDDVDTLRQKEIFQRVYSIYLVDVFIGTPPQKFRLQLDTGSSDLWVFSDKVKRESTAVYNAGQSTSALKLQEDDTLKLEYEEGGRVTGKRLLETVLINNKKLSNQVVGVADYADPQFLKSGSDGVLGLALLDDTWVASEKHLKTPAQNFTPQVFVVKLESWRDNADDPEGSSFCAIGTTEDVPANSIISYTPVVEGDDGFWKVESEDIEIDGRTYTRCDNKAVIDTGSSLAFVDHKTCDKIYAKIQGAMYTPNHGWIFPQHAALPDVHFYVRTPSPLYSPSVLTKDTGWRCEDPLHPDDIRYSDDEKQGYCYGGIQDRGHLKFDIFGDTLLKSIYAIFDVGRKRFGVAQRPERPSSTGSKDPSASETKLSNGAVDESQTKN